jgi:SAM-dependent methyltransferase
MRSWPTLHSHPVMGHDPSVICSQHEQTPSCAWLLVGESSTATVSCCIRARSVRHISTDDLYAAYASTHAGVKDRRAEAGVFREQLAPHLPVSRSARILELGCGQGELLRLMHQAGYIAAMGVDHSEEQVAIARANGIANVILGDIQSVLTEADCLECVVAFDFLEHFSRDDGLSLLSLIHDRLVDGGRLILRVPNAASPLGGYYQFGDLTHQMGYTTRSLSQAARVIGFGSLSTYPCQPPRRGVKSRGRRAASKLVGLLFKLGLVAETGKIRGHVVTANLVAVLRK